MNHDNPSILNIVQLGGFVLLLFVSLPVLKLTLDAGAQPLVATVFTGYVVIGSFISFFFLAFYGD